ncbi:hypothetical protein U1Q18_006111 [Sarracenia purpurea var. burkii]
MCILVHAVKRQPLELPLDGRISNALVEVGPSITLSSLAEVLAFAVGSFTPMPACRVFSMFAALAVLLDFLLQITAFVALIVFDFMRAEDKRADCFPCIKLSGSFTDPNEGIEQRKPGLLARYMKEVHAPILGLWWIKLLVLSTFTAFALASIALSTRIEPGLEQQIVLPRDSYLQGYFSNISEYLRIGPPLYFVVKNYNYSRASRSRPRSPWFGLRRRSGIRRLQAEDIGGSRCAVGRGAVPVNDSGVGEMLLPFQGLFGDDVNNDLGRKI